MPLAKLIRTIFDEKQNKIVIHQDCVLTKEGDYFTLSDPENNNELVKGASKNFIKNEIAKGRLKVDKGWDG